MKARITMLTLGVDDLERAVGFYRDGLGFATEGIVGTEFEHGAVAFFDLQKGLRLALWPRVSLAHDTGIGVTSPSATEFSIGHNVRTEAEVDAVMDRAHRAGGTVVKAAERTFWGGYAGYFRDPDGHLFGGDDLVMNMSMKARIDHVQQSPIDTPGAREGEVILVEFTLAGQSYQALNGGPHDPFNDAISLSVSCRDQAEVDRYWEALIAGGGKPVQCGWLTDKFGVRWQIVPDAMIEMMKDPDAGKSKRVMAAMMEMVKLDVARLKEAYDPAA